MWTLIVDFILISGISILGLIIFFLIKSKTQLSKKLLIAFFASAIFFMLYYYGFLHKIRSVGAIALFFGNGQGYLLGPFLLFYLKSLILPKDRIFPSLFYHLIPYFVVFVFVSIPLSMRLGFRYFTDYIGYYDGISDYLNLLENAYFFVYIVLTYQLLKKIKQSFKNNYSFLDKSDLAWFEYLLIGLAAIITLDSLFSIYELYYPMIPWNIGTIIAFLFVFLYVYLGYHGVFQSKLLLPEFLLEVTEASEERSIDDQDVQQEQVRQLDNLSQEEIDELKHKLDVLLNEKKVYLNDSLSLTDLAEEMGISNKKLSELLNQHLNTSFYNLINDYRVVEVKKRMNVSDNDKFTLLGLAYESGFQSKASFNRVFKNKTGMAPSTYRNTLLKKRMSSTVME